MCMIVMMMMMICHGPVLATGGFAMRLAAALAE